MCVHHLGSLRPEKVVVVQINEASNVGTCVRTYYPVYTCTPDESLQLKLHEKVPGSEPCVQLGIRVHVGSKIK